MGPQYIPGEFTAMIREAVKDIRQTVNETFFGASEHAPEMGAPMTLPSGIVTQEMEGAYEAMKQSIASQSYGREEQQLELE